MATIKGYTLAATSTGSVDWKPSNNMSRTTGSKGATEYIFKLYARYPDREAFTPRAYDEAVARCHSIRDKLTRLNKALKSADGGSGQLAYATEIIDNKTGSDQGIIEVVPLVKGGLSLDQYSGSPQSRLQLAESLAQAMVRLHSAHIRHADLKLENALFVRNGSDLKAVLIDFDHSAPETEVAHPDFVGGTDGYLPPEVLDYFNIEDDEDEELMARLQSRITCKSDIFALGMMLYLLLTLEKATIDPGTSAFRINPDHPSLGGYLTELITAMVAPNPDDRPTAEEVLLTLQNKTFADKLPPFEDLWPEHEGYTLNLTNPTSKLRITKLRRYESNGEKCYKVCFEPMDGHTTSATIKRFTSASTDGYAGAKTYSLSMLRNGGFLIGKARSAAARSTASIADPTSVVTIPGYTILCEGLNPKDSATHRLDDARMRACGYLRIFHCRAAKDGAETYVLVEGNGTHAARSLLNLKLQKIILPK